MAYSGLIVSLPCAECSDLGGRALAAKDEKARISGSASCHCCSFSAFPS